MKPRKALVRRTPMPRGTTPLKRTPLERKTPMPRTQMPRGSGGDASPTGPTPQRRGPVKQRSESTHIPDPIRKAVLARDGHSCVRCGRYLVDTIRYGLQHRRPRQAGGSRLLHTMANLVVLCGWSVDSGTCTARVEVLNRREATADGWLVPHGVTPEEWPVRRWTVDGPRWMQPGDEWTAAVPHPRQLEMGAAA